MKSFSHWPHVPDYMISNFKKWKKVLELKEAGFVFFYPYSDHSYQIKYFLEWLGKDKNNSPNEVAILPTSDDISDIVKLESPSKYGYLIDCAEHLLTPDKERILQKLISASEKSIIPMIFFIEISQIDYLKFSEKFGKTTYLKNLIDYPLYDKKNIFYFIKYFEKKWNYIVPKSMYDQIFQEAGGYLWLVKEILRQIKSDKKTQNEIIQSDSYIWRTNMIWKRLSSEIKNSIIQLYRGQKINENLKQYLFNTRLLNKEISGLFPNYLTRLIEINQRSKIEIINREIIINNIAIGSRFSNYEKKMIILLVNNKDKYVSRDELAKARRGESWTELYSDWAIDQAIYRLRRKLSTIDKTIVISSSRKQGYAISW